MTTRTIKHEVKLPKSVIVILGILAVEVFANTFTPAFSIKEAKAALDVQDYGMFSDGFTKISNAIGGMATCRI